MDRKADSNEASHAQEMMPETTASSTLDGCVCPQCYRPLKAPTTTETPRNRYVPRLREYNGFCFHCLQGCCVVQFERAGKWLIHSFMPLRYEGGKFVGFGPDWMIVNPLPEPPAVLNGPGGDFDEVPDPSYDPAISAIHITSNILIQAANAIGELLKAIEKLRHHESNNRKH